MTDLVLDEHSDFNVFSSLQLLLETIDTFIFSQILHFRVS